MKGSEFIAKAKTLSSHTEVERLVVQCVEAGHYMRWPMVPIPYGGGSVFYAAIDYFAIGTIDDYELVPLSDIGAQNICDLLGYRFLTSHEVDLVHKHAEVKIPPEAMGPPRYPYDASMMSIQRYEAHNRLIDKALTKLGRNRRELVLRAGHKKDLVLTNQLETRPGRLGLYGLHRVNGNPIQGPTVNVRAHYLGYYDYLQGFRVGGACNREKGRTVPAEEVLGRKHSPAMREVVMNPITGLSELDTGPLRVLRHPGVSFYSTSNTPPPSEPSEPSRPVLRYGSRGDVVAEWQRFCLGQGADLGRWRDDGVFGGLTEAATKEIQRDAELPVTGIVDEDDWSLYQPDTEEVPPSAPKLRAMPPPEAIPFVRAKNYTVAEGREVLWIVIHTMEALEHPRTAENVAAWFAGPNAPRASSHYNIDVDSIVQSVFEKDVAWHAAAANRRGIGIEHAGYAKQTDPQWRDKGSMRILARSAGLCADIAQRHDIPVRFVDAEGLIRGDKGFTYHSEVSKACRLARQRNLKEEPWYRNGRWSYTDHGDPGPRFPLDMYLEAVSAAMGE